ncbi:MAG: YihY/virulence factor BrkB family protein [Candidatus Saccharimonadales bacterium]
MQFLKNYWKRITLATTAALGVFGLVRYTKHKELASSPSDLSWKSWKRSLVETWRAIGDKNIGMLSAGIAYFGVLAFFPLMAAIVALAGIAVQPEEVQKTALEISQFVPADIHKLLVTQLENATGNVASNKLVVAVGITLSIIGVAGAIGNTMNALNIMYEIKEKRSFIQQRVTSLVLTLGLIMVMIAIVPLLFAGSDVLKWLGVPSTFIDIFSVVRWVLLAGIMMTSLAVLYHFGPSRQPRTAWQWVSWGAIMATILWVIGSAIFFIYLQYFANFSDSYSLFAGLIALMVWLNLSSFIVLLGAEINHRLEQRAIRTS